MRLVNVLLFVTDDLSFLVNAVLLVFTGYLVKITVIELLFDIM